MKIFVPIQLCLCMILAMCSPCWAQQSFRISPDLQLVVQTGNSDSVQSVAFSGDAKTLVSGSLDHTIKLWEVATGRELRNLNGHSDGVTSVKFSADSKTLASGSFDKTIKLWEVSALQFNTSLQSSNAPAGIQEQ